MLKRWLRGRIQPRLKPLLQQRVQPRLQPRFKLTLGDQGAYNRVYNYGYNQKNHKYWRFCSLLIPDLFLQSVSLFYRIALVLQLNLPQWITITHILFHLRAKTNSARIIRQHDSTLALLISSFVQTLNQTQQPWSVA